MSYRVTCEICNKSEDYSLTCDCHTEEIAKNIERMTGCLIKENHLVQNGPMKNLYQHLVDREGKSFYLRSIIENSTGDQYDPQLIREITQKEFDNREAYGLPPSTDSEDEIEACHRFEDEMESLHSLKDDMETCHDLKDDMEACHRFEEF